MKYICALALLITGVSSAGTLDDLLASASERTQQQETSVNSDVEVIELLRIESPEELEAELTDGYPMPWLEEILNDESIPEEDRYWLDCRIRAHIARHLHRFYDRNGNPVEIEAEWISPGEHYWQEHMMVNPVGEDYGFRETPDYLPDFTGEPGTIVNLYGEQTGEFALTQRGIIMSRDGTIGVLKTGPGDAMHALAPNYVCLLYSDGSFKEIKVDFVRSYGHITVSQDGELIVVCTTDPLLERANGKAVVFDHDGNMLYSTEVGGFPSARPVISPDNQYIAIGLRSRSIVILDAQTGELLRRFTDLLTNSITFSLNNSATAYTGVRLGVGIVDISSSVDSWNNRSLLSNETGSYLGSSISTDSRLVAISGKINLQPGTVHGVTFFSTILHDNHEIYYETASNLDLSPSGCFAFGFNSRRAIGTDYEPSLVTVVSIRERG